MTEQDLTIYNSVENWSVKMTDLVECKLTNISNNFLMNIAEKYVRDLADKVADLITETRHECTLTPSDGNMLK